VPSDGRELAKANIAEAAIKLNEAQELAKLKTKYNEKLKEDTSSGEEWEDVHGMVHQGYSCSDFHGEEDQERTNVRPTTSLPLTMFVWIVGLQAAQGMQGIPVEEVAAAAAPEVQGVGGGEFDGSDGSVMQGGVQAAN
jgi:hypothetical protein